MFCFKKYDKKQFNWLLARFPVGFDLSWLDRSFRRSTLHCYVMCALCDGFAGTITRGCRPMCGADVAEGDRADPRLGHGQVATPCAGDPRSGTGASFEKLNPWRRGQVKDREAANDN